MIGRDGDGDAAEWLPYLLRRGAATTEARTTQPRHAMSRRELMNVDMESVLVKCTSDRALS